MSLSIPGQPPPSLVENRSSTGLAHFKTGDVLEARIVEITSSGRTLFQFAGFRAVSEKPVAGGQIGDVLQFVVGPDENDGAGARQDGRLANHLTQRNPGPGDARPGASNHLLLRLTAPPEKALSAAPAKPSGSATSPQGIASSPAGTPANLTALLPSSIQALAAWIQRFDKMRPGPQRSEGRPPIAVRNCLAAHLDKASARNFERRETMETRPLDRPGEPCGNGFAADFQLAHRPVRMKMQWSSKGGADGDGPGLWTAVFLLNLEGNGAVRVDVKMDPDRIQVVFWVENEAGRRRLAEALPELSSALDPLATQCSLHVAVSPGKILDFEGGEETLPKSARLDVRA